MLNKGGATNFTKEATTYCKPLRSINGSHINPSSSSGFVLPLVIGGGLILMIGGGSEDPTKFSSEIFNFQRLTLAPILLAIGFIIQIFAIMYKAKSS